MKKFALATSKVLNLDYCAIDFVLNNNNDLLLIEVNSNAYFTEIEKISNVNISKMYASFIYKKVYLRLEKS